MFEENVVSSAGTTYAMTPPGSIASTERGRRLVERMTRTIHGAGYRAVPRNVEYEWLAEPS
jgi:hypothetical protein